MARVGVNSIISTQLQLQKFQLQLQLRPEYQLQLQLRRFQLQLQFQLQPISIKSTPTQTPTPEVSTPIPTPTPELTPTLSMAPFSSKASTACWRSWRLFLVRKLMHWCVSWGRCWNALPTPSSTMPVARQLPSRHCQCGANFARRAPTWDPSTLSGWGSCRRLARLLAAVGIGSVAGSPAGASAKGRLLCHCSLGRGGSRRPQTIEDWCPWCSLLWWCRFRAGLGITVSLGECDWWPSHPVRLSDGSHGVLKDLGLWTQNMPALERCRPHGGKDQRLEPEILQQGVTVQQLKIGSHGCASRNLLGPDTVLGQQKLLSHTQSVGPVTPAESAKADESAGPVIPAESSISAGLGGKGITVMVLFLSLLWCNRGQQDLTSGHVWQPRHHAVRTLTSVMKLGSGPGLQSAVDLEWWRWWWVAELEGRTSVAFPKHGQTPELPLGQHAWL